MCWCHQGKEVSSRNQQYGEKKKESKVPLTEFSVRFCASAVACLTLFRTLGSIPQPGPDRGKKKKKTEVPAAPGNICATKARKRQRKLRIGGKWGWRRCPRIQYLDHVCRATTINRL